MYFDKSKLPPLLVSRSEYPREKPLLLKMASYLKKYLKINIKEKKNPIC
jgi:hypothetical protein